MDFNVMCKDPNFVGLCNNMAILYKMSQSLNQNRELDPYNPYPTYTKPDSNPKSPDSDDKLCNPDRFSRFIGAAFDPKENSFKLKDGSLASITDKDVVGKRFRIIGPTTMTTKDLDMERLNIYYENDSKRSEDSGTVTKINCG